MIHCIGNNAMHCPVTVQSARAAALCWAAPREMSATFCEPGSEERAPAAARRGPWQPGLGAAKVRLQRGLETPPTPAQQMKNVSRSLRYSRGFLSGDFHKNVHTQTLAPPCTLQAVWKCFGTDSLDSEEGRN